MVLNKNFFHPLAWPVYFFALLIAWGSLALYSDVCQADNTSPIAFIDALFIAVSAACVTGLATIDISQVFNIYGQIVMLILIQVGGLGLLTISSLFFFLRRKKTRLVDIITVGQVIRGDQSFRLGPFLRNVVLLVLTCEGVGAIFIYLAAPQQMDFFKAVFHSVSAFCNAGFSLYSNSLESFATNPLMNLSIMALIIVGGLGYAVLVEIRDHIKYHYGRLTRSFWFKSFQRFQSFSDKSEQPHSLANIRNFKRWSWPTKIVLSTTLMLIGSGAILIWFGELQNSYPSQSHRFWTAIFQSVTARTAGFNTTNINLLSEVSLFVLCGLMFIGGSPGSAAGGLKTTTFRVLIAAAWSHLKGRKQAVIGHRAIEDRALKTAFTLFLFSIVIVALAFLALSITEGGLRSHHVSGGRAFELFFEVVSAFGTVGLTTGITPGLTTGGKMVIVFLMFIGRLGPLMMVAFISNLNDPRLYNLPEEKIMIG